METVALEAVVLLLTLSVFAVLLLRRLHMPPLLGYLLVGVIGGPYALGWFPDSDLVRLLAEIGVVFLLFSIGLEFSVPQLLALGRSAFGIGAAQVVLCALGVGVVVWMLGLSWRGALIAGGALAMSSTAIALRQMTEQLELQSRHGRLSLGILLFQDIAVVPFLVAIPILAGDAGDGWGMPLALALLKGALAFGLMLALGHWALRPVFHLIAESKSAELFTLSVLLIALAAAALTYFFGLSLALGAFLAGMMLGETEYRHQIEADVRPFRDVLMALFFISIGFALDLSLLPVVWRDALLLLFVLVVGKVLIVAALVRFAGYESGVALRAGLVLAQAGEFSFALLALAVNRELISAQESQALLVAVILSMVMAPLLIRYNGAIAKRLFAGTYLRGIQLRAQQVDEATRDLHDHVVLCGFGRIGQNLARFLRQERIDYVALEVDPVLVKAAWESGERVFYGDCTRAAMLEAAGVGRARALVITVDNASAALCIVKLVRLRHAKIAIVVRTRDDAHFEEIEAAGATSVVPETVEASMMLATQLLRRFEVPADEVERLVEQSRQDHYQSLRGVFRGSSAATGTAAANRDLQTVLLSPRSHAVGRALDELRLAQLGVAVTAVVRGDIRGEAPDSGMILHAGDALILQGTPNALEQAENRVLKG